MAGSFTTPNTFGTQTGPIPLNQWDANYTAIAGQINNTANYSNYYQDGSLVANSIIVTINSPTTFAYTAGTTLLVKVANTNSGATTINVNGLGAIQVRTSALSALSSGQITAGGVYPFFFDGTYFQLQTQATSITGAQVNAALGYTAGYINIPQNSQTAAYVAAATDVGKHIYITTGGVTVNASVFNAGDVFMVINNSAVSQTITQGSGVTLRLAGTATTGSRTLGQYGSATLLCLVGGATPTFQVSGPGVS